MTETLTTIKHTYPDKFRKITPIGGIVTAKTIEDWYGIKPKRAMRWFKKAQLIIKKDIFFVNDWAIHKGYINDYHFSQEIAKFLK